MVKTLEQFETLTSEQLATIEGGGKGICKPVYTGANGYSCRYSNGEWGYVSLKETFKRQLM